VHQSATAARRTEAIGRSAMNVLLWILFGALVGWIASLIMKTNRQQGTLIDIIVGVVGAVIGGFLFETLGRTGVTGFNLYSMFVAVIGAIILLAIVKAVRRP
jgi:uncharacterized membrane protein YeaQ/YmgE (transglycosylase-associated protein family)